MTLWYVNFIFAHMILAGGAYLFYNYNFEKSVWLSLISVFMRNIWGVSAAILFLGFISKFECELCFIRISNDFEIIHKFSMTFIAGAKRFLNWHVFTPLGRLTYSIYVSHLSVGRFIFGRSKTLASFTYATLVK